MPPIIFMKKIAFLLHLMLGGSILFAQTTGAEPSLLWKISGKDLKAPSFLFGTIHIICSDQFLWTDTMKSTFNSVQQLQLELPMADADFQKKIIQAVMLTDSTSLKDYFSDGQYKKLEQYFKDSMKTSLSVFAKLKPFGVMSFIMRSMLRCDGKLLTGYESKLINFAQEKNIPVRGLETIEEQIKIFDDIPKDSMAAIVMAIIEDMPKNKKQFKRITQYYVAQDIQSLHNEIIKSPEYAGYMDELLYKRNEKWVPKIIQTAKEKSVFFAVGAGHLPGDRGIINLLKKLGYGVTAVK